MDMIWLPSYPPGVPAKIDPGRYSSLAHLFEEACGRFADQAAFVSMGREMTYRELDGESRRFAGWLQARGLAKGDRVALMMPNLLQYPVALLGALRAGCVVVGCNPLYTPRELEHQLKDSGAVALIILENFARTFQEVAGRTAVRHVVVTSLGEMLGQVKGRLVDFLVRKVRKLVPEWSLDGAVGFAEALEEGGRHGFSPVALARDDLAFLQYTGGTTGVSKGAMLTHGNVAANVLQARAWVEPVLAEGRESVVTALPLYHIFALTANCMLFLALGGQNLLIVNPRDIRGLVKELSRRPFTVLTGVNTLFSALMAHPDFAGLDFSHLKVSLGGGMAVQRAVAERWRVVTGKPVLQAYGLTEASPGVAINPLHIEEFDGSVGLPLPSTEVSIRDEPGEEVSRGQAGEIWVRGPQVMDGYWQRPAETASALTEDGFLRTGDLGYIDPRGFVFLVDRKKDMILVSGFNVYPNEVEEAVALHPGVQEVAAVGVPDGHSGEAVKVFVVRRDPKLTAEALLEHCRRELAGYKVPKQVEFRDDLPRTNVGKILRRALREG